MESYSQIVSSRETEVDEQNRELNINLILCDSISKNNSLYGYDELMRSLEESKFVQSCIKNSLWFGEYEHPPRTSPLSRILKIEPERYAWKIKKYWGDRNSGIIKGRVKFVNPMGIDIAWKNIIEDGSNYASSIRAYTPNYVTKNENGKKYVVKKYPMYPVTFDLVTYPGFDEARIIKIDGANGFYNPENVVEYKNPTKEIDSMIKSEESYNIIMDYLGVDINEAKTMYLDSKNKTIRYSFEDNSDITVPLNTFLMSKILSSKNKYKTKYGNKE